MHRSSSRYGNFPSCYVHKCQSRRTPLEIRVHFPSVKFVFPIVTSQKVLPDVAGAQGTFFTPSGDAMMWLYNLSQRNQRLFCRGSLRSQPVDRDAATTATLASPLEIFASTTVGEGQKIKRTLRLTRNLSLFDDARLLARPKFARRERAHAKGEAATAFLKPGHKLALTAEHLKTSRNLSRRQNAPGPSLGNRGTLDVSIYFLIFIRASLSFLAQKTLGNVRKDTFSKMSICSGKYCKT